MKYISCKTAGYICRSFDIVLILNLGVSLQPPTTIIKIHLPSHNDAFYDHCIICLFAHINGMLFAPCSQREQRFIIKIPQ